MGVIRRYVGCVLGALVLVAGCSSDPSTPGEAFCSGYCRLVERCGGGADYCEENCVSQRPGLAKLSLEGAKRVGDCIAGYDCSLLSDPDAWDTGTRACFDAASASVPPSEHLRAFCAKFAEHWFECGAWFSTSDCEHAYDILSDAMLDAFATCERESDCAKFASCVTTTQGGS